MSDDIRAWIAEARERHVRGDEMAVWCAWCGGDSWPCDAALALDRLEAAFGLAEAARAFTRHHDAGQAGEPGYPWTYGEVDVWQAEWDRRYDALRVALRNSGDGAGEKHDE